MPEAHARKDSIEHYVNASGRDQIQQHRRVNFLLMYKLLEALGPSPEKLALALRNLEEINFENDGPTYSTEARIFIDELRRIINDGLSR